MTRRQLLSIPAAGPVTARIVLAQAVYSGTAYRDYCRCLPDHLRGLAREAYRLRNAAIARLSSPAAARARQRWVTETFWRLVGGMPERTPLNPRTVGSFERDGYKVEKVVYESQPGLHIPANLYIPTTGKPPFPGVLFQMGHSANGKAADLYQRCCQGLVRLGYLVLAFDPMGQGERIYYPGALPGRSRAGGATGEHNMAGRQMLLVGDTATRMQVWDAVRSLDYLASHPLVDPRRLASTGQSGGGTLTMLLTAVDDRLAAAAAASPNSENFACANFNPPGSTDDAEQNLLSSGPLGFDRWDLFYPLAPKPLLVLVSDRDFFGTYSPNYIASGWEEFRKLKKVYAALGKADQLAWFSTPMPHGLAHDLRLQIYNWFERWLKDPPGKVGEEPPVQPEPDETLWVTARGNVVAEFQGKTPFLLTRARVTAKRTAGLDQLLGIRRAEPGLRAAQLGRASFRDVAIEAIEVPSAPGVWVPAWFYQPRKPDRSRPVLLLVDPSGRGAWGEGQLYHHLAAAGCAVCAADLRGLGDLAPEFSRGPKGNAARSNSDDSYAWASLILGKPLLGQRITDLLALVEALRSRPDLAGRRLVLAARGFLTVSAQIAAALQPAIDVLYLAGGLVSYRHIVETEDYSHPFANFVPRLLEYTDLPELAASMAPRRIVLAGAIDGAGKRMDVAAVQAAYQAASNVAVLPEARWDAAGLLAM